MSAPDEMTVAAPDPRRGVRLMRVAFALILVGAVLTVLAYLQEDSRSRMSAAYLLGFVFCWSIVLGSAFFLGLQHATKSVWSVVVRRVAEALASPIWLVAVLFVPVVLFAVFDARFSLFPWANPATVEQSELLQKKAPYLDVNFFMVRGVVFFLIWGLFTTVFVRSSLKQDDLLAGEKRVKTTLRLRTLSAPFIILFGLTMTFASFDWLMSLEPAWFSTIFGVYVFSGMTVAALAAITLGVIGARKHGWLGEGLVRPDHLYNLGALLFVFTCFWAYIAFSQYMLIWYANLPEETFWFADRMKGGWGVVSILVALLRFVVPFFLLLARDAKSNPRRLVTVSILVLVGQLVDLYWLIKPANADGSPALGWQELGPPLLLVGLLVLAIGFFVRRHRMVAVGDPMLEASRNFHL